jgi:serine/threonine-protein kinase
MRWVNHHPDVTSPSDAGLDEVLGVRFVMECREYRVFPARPANPDISAGTLNRKPARGHPPRVGGTSIANSIVNAAVVDPSAWRRMAQYLDELLELEAPTRERWLKELASTQPEMAERLRTLLSEQHAFDSNRFLEHSPPFWNDLLSTHESLAGQCIGAYTIDRLLGRGGMGEVWLASRSDGRFEGQCAIKFLDDWLVQTQRGERFRHEGRLLARLAHPNIARLFDAGTSERGRPYLVLEYVDGEPLDRHCESHSLDIESRVRLFLDVVSAVAHAHAQLIIHRDLKPSNVLVARDGSVKLLDFGVAKLLSADHADSEPGLTQYQGVALTPEYAAPEQLLGEEPSTATDVYQLGMLLYELLAGRHPMPRSDSRSERIKAALNAYIPRASELAPPERRKALRGDLDAILSMALRRQPSERYVTAAALRDELVRYLNGEPVSARRGATLYATRKFVRRHQVAAVVSGIALTSLCAALVFAFSQARVAAVERDHALALVSRNEAVTEFLGTVLTEAAGSDKAITVHDILARAERLARADTSDNRENRAAVLGMLADDYEATGDFGNAERLGADALTVLGDSSNHGLRSELVCAHAYALSTTGQMDAALRAISPELAKPATDPASYMQCLHDRALIASSFGEPDNALRYALAALAMLRSVPRKSAETEAIFLATAAGGYRMRGQQRAAFDYFAQAMRKLEEVGRAHGTTAIVIRNNLAIMSSSNGAPRRALQLLDEVLHDVTARDPGSPLPAYLLFNRGRALELMGRYREARAEYESCAQLATQSKSPYDQLNCHLGLAAVARHTGETETAAQHLAQAASLLAPTEPADSVTSIRLAFERGSLAVATGKLEEARVQFERALASQRSRQTTIEARLGLAETELRAGNITTAAAVARLALSAATAQQGALDHSEDTGRAWLMLGRALRELGDEAQARKAFDAAIEHLSNTVDPDHPALMQARDLASDSAAVRIARAPSTR